MKGNGPILVVDDEEIVRDSLASWLEEDGFQVETAPDGPTAVARLHQRAYPILLVDLKMPGMDGLAVLGEARRLQPDAAVILMTALSNQQEPALRRGIEILMEKPLDLPFLLKTIESLLVSKTPVGQNVGV